MPNGAFRRVVLVGGSAFKLPRLKHLLLGMRCNRWEREMWYVWRLKFGWENLCPVRYADPLGLLVVMRRAEQPITREELDAEDPDYYPDITAERKPQDHGRVDGRIVALDYGLPDADMVAARRTYYASSERR